ncbi:glycosyltransferase 61 family protein [Salinibacter sp.]
MEDLSFPDQVELFAESEIVVGAHGAGLANLLFCRDATGLCP